MNLSIQWRKDVGWKSNAYLK